MTRDESRAAWWALVRHFFRSHFDLGFLTSVGADMFTRVVLGVLAGTLVTELLLARVLLAKYTAMVREGLGALYAPTLLGDDTLVTAVPMIVVGFVTVLVSNNLFPSEADFRILMPLPVSKRYVFSAKVTALLMFVGLFAVVSVLALVPPYVFVSMTPWAQHSIVARVLAHGLATVVGVCAVAAAVVAVVGWTAIAVAPARVRLAIGLLQTVLVLAFVLALPAAFQWAGQVARAGDPQVLAAVPPGWFTGMARALLGEDAPAFAALARAALLAFVASIAAALACYAIVYRRFDAAWMSAAPMRRSEASARPKTVDAGTVRTATRGHPAWEPRAAGRAVTAFTYATLRRSALHRGLFAGILALGIGLAGTLLLAGDAIAWLREGGEPTVPLKAALLFTPFILIFASVAGLRATLLLPVDAQANWLFRLTESDATRRYQLASIERAFLVAALAAPLLVVAPLEWLWLGGAVLNLLVVAGLGGAILIQIVLLEWRRLPFTCTYLPGKKFIMQAAVAGLSALLLFGAAGTALAGMAVADSRLAVAIVVVLGGVAVFLRSFRLRGAAELPLVFEDAVPRTTEPIELSAD